MRGTRCAKNSALQHTCQDSFPLRNQYDDRQAMISRVDQAVILAAGAPIRGRSGQTRTAIDRIAQAAHQTVDGVAHAADGAAGWVGQSAEQWQARQEQALEACRSSVRERPMVAIGIALLAGFIVGRWLVR